VIQISGISALDNNATLANAGVAYVVLKDWAVRGKGPGICARSLPICRAERQGRRRGRLRAHCRRRSRASAMPAGFTMQVESRDGNFDYDKLERVTRTIIADGKTQSALQP
jgi:HAE1 family hydrophobic/amphiphilic exporter-1